MGPTSKKEYKDPEGGGGRILQDYSGEPASTGQMDTFTDRIIMWADKAASSKAQVS